MTDEEFDRISVGDEMHVTHQSGYSIWSSIGRVVKRTGHQVTVRVGSQDVVIRRRSREWRLHVPTTEDLAHREQQRRWGRVYWLLDRVPEPQFGGVDHWRWSPPDFPTAVLDLLLQAADALEGHSNGITTHASGTPSRTQRARAFTAALQESGQLRISSHFLDVFWTRSPRIRSLRHELEDEGRNEIQQRHCGSEGFARVAEALQEFGEDHESRACSGPKPTIKRRRI